MRSVTDEYKRLTESIFSRHRSVGAAGFTADAYKPGLEGMRRFDAHLGGPSERLRCIHVAGTNGKGSVSHMLASALAATGLRVGLYTSPHLLDFRERIKIVGPAEEAACEGVGPAEETGHKISAGKADCSAAEMIPCKAVVEFLRRHRRYIDREGLSFFEITTGMALWWFGLSKVDTAVFEVGLGGRLDSTNIIRPALCVVTSIGLDHCELLGDTRALVAAEKAGIFKSGVPALVWGHDNETDSVFAETAAAVGAPLYFADDLQVPDLEQLPPLMDLRGEYQLTNIRTALAALSLLGVNMDNDSQAQTAARGIRLTNDRLRNAILHTAELTGLRGRWETLGTEPLVIADIGHNPAALEHNFAQLEEMMSTGGHDRLIVVFGIMADKDLDGIIPLMPHGAELIFATASTPRALPAREILKRFQDLRGGEPASGLPPATACDSVAEAISLALTHASPRSLIYIGGSNYVVSDALKTL